MRPDPRSDSEIRALRPRRGDFDEGAPARTSTEANPSARRRVRTWRKRRAKKNEEPHFPPKTLPGNPRHFQRVDSAENSPPAGDRPFSSRTRRRSGRDRLDASRTRRRRPGENDSIAPVKGRAKRRRPNPTSPHPLGLPSPRLSFLSRAKKCGFLPPPKRAVPWREGTDRGRTSNDPTGRDVEARPPPFEESAARVAGARDRAKLRFKMPACRVAQPVLLCGTTVRLYIQYSTYTCMAVAG